MAELNIETLLAGMEGEELTIREIQGRVAVHYNVSMERIVIGSQQRANVLPRHVAMYCARRYTRASLEEIGEAFGGHYTTVIYAVQKIRARLGSESGVELEAERRLRRVRRGERLPSAPVAPPVTRAAGFVLTGEAERLLAQREAKAARLLAMRKAVLS